MSWNEMTVSKATERSIDGYWHHTRLFRVKGWPRASILANLGSITQYDLPPADGEPNPTLPTIGERSDRDGIGPADTDEVILSPDVRVWAYNAVVIPTDVPLYTDVEIRYTNDPRLIAQKTEDQLTFQSATMDLPVGVRSVVATLNGPSVGYWTVARLPFPYTVGRLSQVVILKNADIPNCRRQVVSNTNLLHALPIDLADAPNDITVMRFEGADIIRYSPSYYMVRYSWQYDAGHRSLFMSAANMQEASLKVNLPPQNLTFFTDGSPVSPGSSIAGVFCRPPYYTLDAIVEFGGGSSQTPTYYGMRSNSYGGGLWSTLPGVTF